MISSLKIELKTDKINRNMASLMHGVIMENVSPEFGEMAHVSGIRDFSQYILQDKDGRWNWYINSLDEEAQKNIIDKFLLMDSIYLESKELEICLGDKEIKKTSIDELFERNYYSKEGTSRFVDLEFLTPTSFKCDGNYQIFPSVKSILLSIIKKHDAISKDTVLYDQNTAEKFDELVDISRYNLRSTLFSLEGVQIPSFFGRLTLAVKGGKNMISLVNFLADFAQYSGIGIKSALGMGAVKHNTERGGK